MAQELENLSFRLDSLTDQVSELSHLLAYTAGTPGAPPNSIVRLGHLDYRLNLLSGNVLAAIDVDRPSHLAATRETRDLKRIVHEHDDAHSAAH